MKEILLGIAPVMQPKPNRNPAGDCFACALTAVMRHLYRDRPPSFDDVWQWFMQETATGAPQLSNSWHGMRVAMMGGARKAGLPVEVAAEVCQPAFFAWEFPHDFHWQPPMGLYSQRLEAYLRAGWVAVTSIAYHGPGPVDAEFRTNFCDHYVLLDGVREGESRNNREIHVVCSVKGGYWLTEHRLLAQYGAGAWWLMRRADA